MWKSEGQAEKHVQNIIQNPYGTCVFTDPSMVDAVCNTCR